MSHSSRFAVIAVRFFAVVGLVSQATAQTGSRPMTFLDVQEMRSAGGVAYSPDGRQALYTLTTPNWKEARSQTDIYLVSTQTGVSSTKQLTFTKDKNETQPRWAPDGSFFLFASNRDAAPNATGGTQLYMMRTDGGEARKITEARDGVSTWDVSKDGTRLVYRSGAANEEQLYSIAFADLKSRPDSVTPTQLTRHATGIGTWSLSPDSKRVYFTTPDTVDKDEKARRDKRFTVDIRNAETPLASLWVFDIDAKKTTRLTKDAAYTVANFTISDDNKWVGYRAISANRYERNITEQTINGDLFLLDVATGGIERLTNNSEVGENGPSFSPDGQTVAFSAPDDLTKYSMKNTRVYVRRIGDRGGQWRKLGSAFDGDVSVGFWSDDSRTIYFNEGIKATNQFMSLDVASGTVKQLSQFTGVANVARDDDTKRITVSYSDGKTPGTTFAVPSLDQVTNRAAWIQLTDANPQVRSFALGDQEEITWKSTDGRMIGGVLVRPAGYRAGTRYPLIVAIHGGPAAADMLGFNGGYGAQIYAGAGYAVLMPNYRGSTNYGEKHKNDIVGNYFPQAFDDIMTGVNHLIREGLVDSTKMGALGWSAGGHWSNWILTHTDRFKAISSGAGTSNWISMYAESDVQRNRQYYLGNKLPYDDFDAYWTQSPLKYIKNAKTPTMIHVVEGDPRVPSPQSVELHMALKKLGVPTEFFMYPGNTHGIPDPRNRYVKSVAEMAWMDYWLRGSGKKFEWRDVLKSLEDARATTANISQ
ncbi:MAG TPA: S9 family peptidase [Gemmatimonadaceae bacterium]|nr:S9 family peptidase [Gemmatimonadaceae bacterium]